MKTIGKVLIGWGLVTILMFWMQASVVKADLITPDDIIALLMNTKPKLEVTGTDNTINEPRIILDPRLETVILQDAQLSAKEIENNGELNLDLQSKLTATKIVNDGNLNLAKGSQLITTGGVINEGTLSAKDAYIEGNLSGAGTLNLDGFIAVSGTASAAGGNVSLGRIAPRPPLPLPGKPPEDSAFWGQLVALGIQAAGVGIFGESQITMNSLFIDFDGLLPQDESILDPFAPSVGDKFFIAATTDITSPISIGALSSNLNGLGISFSQQLVSFNVDVQTQTLSRNGSATQQILVGVATVTPEPGTMILLGFGLLGLAGIGRRKSA